MSALQQAVADYLVIRRAMGFKLVRTEKFLTQFVAYLHEHDTEVITVDLALAWAMSPAEGSTPWWGRRLSAVRVFAAHLQAIDPRVQVPPGDLLPCPPQRATPYLYDEADITALMQAAAALTLRSRAATYQTLIGLLAVSGMRVGEAIGLDLDDFDPGTGILIVRNTKFGKSRQIPLHPSTVTALSAYLITREDYLGATACPALFISTRRKRLNYNVVAPTFRRLSEAAGLLTRSSSCRPRIHDLRHSFAVTTVLDAYASGADVQPVIPRLATYLGHADPKHTYWYLSAAPELLALAAARMDAHQGRIS